MTDRRFSLNPLRATNLGGGVGFFFWGGGGLFEFVVLIKNRINLFNDVRMMKQSIKTSYYK